MQSHFDRPEPIVSYTDWTLAVYGTLLNVVFDESVDKLNAFVCAFPSNPVVRLTSAFSRGKRIVKRPDTLKVLLERQNAAQLLPGTLELLVTWQSKLVAAFRQHQLVFERLSGVQCSIVNL